MWCDENYYYFHPLLRSSSYTHHHRSIPMFLFFFLPLFCSTNVILSFVLYMYANQMIFLKLQNLFIFAIIRGRWCRTHFRCCFVLLDDVHHMYAFNVTCSKAYRWRSPSRNCVTTQLEGGPFFSLHNMYIYRCMDHRTWMHKCNQNLFLFRYHIKIVEQQQKRQQWQPLRCYFRITFIALPWYIWICVYIYRCWMRK